MITQLEQTAVDEALGDDTGAESSGSPPHVVAIEAEHLHTLLAAAGAALDNVLPLIDAGIVGPTSDLLEAVRCAQLALGIETAEAPAS